MSNYKISFVTVITKEKGYNETLENLVQYAKKYKGCQVIVVDAICSEETQQAINSAKAMVCDRLESLSLTDSSEAECFNLAFDSIKGEYTVFVEEGVTYKSSVFSAFLKKSKRYPQAYISGNAVSITKDGNLKRYADYNRKEAPKLIDLTTYPYYGQSALSCYFFTTDKIKGLRFDESIHEESKKKFIIEALVSSPLVYRLPKYYNCLYSHPLENDNNLFEDQYNKWYYTESITGFMIPFMKDLKAKFGKVPEFVQYMITQLICAKYANNHYESDKGVLNQEEAYEFYEATLDALMYIDNAIFTEAAINCKYIIRAFWMQLLKAKHQKVGIPYEIRYSDELITFHTEDSSDARITTPISVGITINQMNYDNGKLEFDAEFSGKDFLELQDIELYAEYAGKKVRLSEYPVYNLLKCFCIPYAKKYKVHFFVPVTDDLKTIKFGYMLCGEYQQLPIHFAGQFSRLRLRFGKSYWKFNDKLALGVRNNNTLYTFKCTGFRHFAREIGLYFSMLLHTRNKFFACQCIGLRLIYRLTQPFYKNRRILLTFDKLYKAGDNGEYFWRYANSVADGIETYYVVSDTSLDYPRLKEYDKKHTVVHNSLKCRLLALNMEAIVATHTLVMQYCGFPKYLHPYFLDLWNVKVICIQHGLTVQQLAQYQRRNYDNTTLYCLASKYEKQNLMHRVYGYEESMLKLDGLARYDGLKNNDKKVILITPTWRRNVVSAGIAYKKKAHSEHFKQTEYFRLYNNLINDRKLIECAKENGYAITYLLHPAMSPQLEDFDKNEYVNIIAASGDMNYEKVLTESSLMITDYSGVQFDFAYMRKPIVYYHPDTLPPHYEAGGIDYPTQGFGPICTNHSEVVEAICNVIKNGCKNSDEYKRRADDFFEFDDHNNCERIYNDIVDFLDK